MKRRLVLATTSTCKKRRPVTVHLRNRQLSLSPSLSLSQLTVKQEDDDDDEQDELDDDDDDDQECSQRPPECNGLSETASEQHQMQLTQYLKQHVTHLYRCDLCQTVIQASQWPALELHFLQRHRPQVQTPTSVKQQPESERRQTGSTPAALSPNKSHSASASSCCASPSLSAPGLSHSALLTLEMVQSIAGELRNRCSQCGEAFDSEMAVLLHQVKAHEVDASRECARLTSAAGKLR